MSADLTPADEPVQEEGISPRGGQGRFRSGRTLGRLACTSITS